MSRKKVPTTAISDSVTMASSSLWPPVDDDDVAPISKITSDSHHMIYEFGPMCNVDNRTFRECDLPHTEVTRTGATCGYNDHVVIARAEIPMLALALLDEIDLT